MANASEMLESLPAKRLLRGGLMRLPRTVLSAMLLTSLCCAPAILRAVDLRTDATSRLAVEARGATFAAAIDSTDAAFRARAIREVIAPATLAAEGEARWLTLLGRLRDHLGRFAFHHAEAHVFGEGEGRRVSLHVFGRSATTTRWHDVQLMLEPAWPHRIVSLAFLAEVAEPVYLPNGDITEPSTLAWLHSYLDRLVADDDLAGGLLIAQGDRILIDRTFGHADAGRTRRIGPGTRFSLASGGKMFTALAVARSVERGRLRFTDTLARVLPAVAHESFAERVTLGHLLSHMSGVGEYWTPAYERRRPTIDRLSDYLPFVLAAGMTSPPGTRYEYSNSNYLLAGLVLEAATGRAYDDVLRDEVLRPAGMQRTGLDRFSDTDTSQVQQLSRDPTGWRIASRGVRGSSAGGALSTMHDMLAFSRALRAGRIVSDSMLAILTRPQATGTEASGDPYGYGFQLAMSPGGVRSYGHGGIAAGSNFVWRYFPDLDITVIAFSNQDNGAYDDLRRNVIRLVTGER